MTSACWGVLSTRLKVTPVGRGFFGMVMMAASGSRTVRLAAREGTTMESGDERAADGWE